MTSGTKATYRRLAMSHVPLIPFQRPVPQAFLRPETEKSAGSTKPKKQKKAKMAAPNSKQKPRFEATNTDDIKQMPADVQRLWRILEKQDPNGEVFTADMGIVVLDGEGPEERTPKALRFKAEDVELMRAYGVYDGPKANDPATATGVIFTQYQMIQLAYELGRQAESRKVVKDFKKVIESPPPVENDYDEDEDEDDEEEFDDDEMEVIDEEEDEEVDGDDNDNEEDDVEEDE